MEKLSKQIEITITPEGLRIELIEGKNGTFYESGSAKLSSSGQELLALLGTELKTLPNILLIEGHTDATPYSNTNGEYTNWELSADRANSARRLLQQDGVRGNQVTQVRGYADQFLRLKDNPTDPSNRRISILIKNDVESVPLMSASNVVNGTTPIPKDDVKGGAGAPAGKPEAGGKATGGAKPEAGKKAEAESKPVAPPPAPVPAKPAPAQAPAKPAAATPTPKLSLIDKLKAMLPGKKK